MKVSTISSHIFLGEYFFRSRISLGVSERDLNMSGDIYAFCV